MNLHRVEGGKPQWENERPEEWNVWQKIANWSGGLVAPANAVTIAGGLSSNSGINDIRRGKIRSAFLKLLVGRVGGDVGDGAVAEATRTKNPKGEALDAFTDKALATRALIVGMQEKIIPKYIGVPILAEQAAISTVSFAGNNRGHRVQPDAFDKFAHATVWLGLGLLLASHDTELEPKTQQSLHSAGMAVSGVATVMGLVTLCKDTRKAFADNPVQQHIESGE